MAHREWNWTSFLLGLVGGMAVAGYSMKVVASRATVGDWRTLSARRGTGLRIRPPTERRPRLPLSNGGYSP